MVGQFDRPISHKGQGLGEKGALRSLRAVGQDQGQVDHAPDPGHIGNQPVAGDCRAGQGVMPWGDTISASSRVSFRSAGNASA